MQDRPVPFDAVQRRLLPVADLVMILMISRPPSGSLRDTRVTTVTIVLAAAVAAVATLLGAFALLAVVAGTPAWLLAAGVLLAFALGCLDLTIYGMRQRLI